MKKLYYLPIALFAISMGTQNVTAQASKGVSNINLDTKAQPGDDFFRFATGGWADANPIPDEFSRYGSFDQLRDNTQSQIKGLIEDLGKTGHTKGTLEQKIGDLYRIGMDSARLNADGAAPIKEQLKAIHDTKNVGEIIKIWGQINRYASSPFFDISVDADLKNSKVNILSLSQGGLGMGTRDYYLNDDSRDMRDKYAALIVTQFLNAGYSEADARFAAGAVLRIETKLAEAHYTNEKRRIPEENYHKMDVSDLYSKVGSFDWTGYFKAVGINKIEAVDVSQIEPIAVAIDLVQNSSLDEVKYYLAWKVIDSAAPYLSDNFVSTNFEFYGKEMSGQKAMQPRWKRTVSSVNGALGEEVGQMYVAEYFPPKAKQRMVKLVDNLQKSLGERINGLEWMSKDTKKKAQEKLSTFIVKIGYPDKWRNSQSLEIKEDSYWANICRSSEFAYNEMLLKLTKPVDPSDWYMTPQTVNAYYNPTTNEICFPAGILQPPFFYMDADDASNYGAIGVVIGHEMTHGFDDSGRKFDKDGNLADWWTPEDGEKFEKRAQVMVDFFDNIVVIDTLHANGQFTLGENIADHGGLQVSYHAFLKTKEGKANKKIDGYTARQRFFLSYAALWAGHVRDAEIKRLTKIDPHSLGEWRVNGALPQIDAWYEAFNVTEKDKMFVPKPKRVSIW